MSFSLTTLRDHAVAAFVVFHVGVTTLQAIPLPQKVMTAGNLTRSGAEDSAEAWLAPLVASGVLADEEAGLAWLLELNNTIVQTRRKVLDPFRPYYNLTGTGQSWHMFSSVRPLGARLQIYLQDEPGGVWRPLYVEHSWHRWQWRLLNQERVRTVRSYFSKHNGLYRDTYDRLAAHLAREAAAEFPEAHALRVQYQQLRIQPPARIRKVGGLELGKVFWMTTLELEPLR